MYSARLIALLTTRTWRPRHLPSLTRTIRTQTRRDYESPENDFVEDPYMIPAGVATPRQLAQYLDEYVVGQENAKKVLSVAVFNHYNRVRANISLMQDEMVDSQWSEVDNTDPNPSVASAQLHPHPRRMSFPSVPLQSRTPIPLFEKSNVLVIGPTGSGKTLLARTLARVLDVPFSVSDATSFTQAGYVGDDVDACIQRLLQAANWDPYRASMGIVYIDEVDKITRKSGSGGPEGTRDVGGEGVQQALLRMMEGSVVTIQSKGGAIEGPGAATPDSRTRPPRSLSGSSKPETYHIDTSNVLFILSGAFVGLETVIKRRVVKGSIGFAANLAPAAEENSSGFMPFFTPNNKTTSTNVLDLVEPVDLVKYGFIPEFISRLPSITTLAPLTPSDLRRILTDVRGSLVSQYTSLFGYSGVEIRFSSAALDEICQKAAERGGGARGLRGIMESLLLEAMYEVPGSNIRHVLITKETVRGEDPMYWTKGEGAAFWGAWAEQEAQYEKKTL
ncbi:hypothetical protein JAAARDRAFT_28304 [Jaapia argillacea MUCL 33604]|uniref:AAA+ ATPase domain-containing protein n=1 Tax=Jaapia argillacea MUCL 33604 TaxID=933084 RepID=A0A067QPU7_9AGAM|nr:hypothetical protein JAAARDRAFT_28304 [Jaapia argillacea MUCL 33604]